MASTCLIRSTSTSLLLRHRRHRLRLPVRATLCDPEWRAAMQKEEFDAIQANDTWTLVPQPTHANVITGMISTGHWPLDLGVGID